MQLQARTGDLLAWFEQTRRDLPWRRTRDPWAVLVSEFMLQQTQVERVVEPYTRFVERFPTARACADADLGEVLRLWAGLGYNRRAVRLHAAARAVEKAGGFPDDLEGLLALDGVGPYTARAVLVFAFEQPHGVVDTNAARYLARAVAGRRLSTAEAQRLADDEVPDANAWDYNQAVLDLGARVCRRRSPACGSCPVVTGCAWAASGWPEPDPADGTAGSSRPQAAFEGSDRQGRGRIVDALRSGPVAIGRVAEASGWPGDADRAARVVDDLVAEGLAHYDGQMLVLGRRDA